VAAAQNEITASIFAVRESSSTIRTRSLRAALWGVLSDELFRARPAIYIRSDGFLDRDLWAANRG
jgi:hypothetical protein